MRVSWCPGGPGCREWRQTARSCTWSSSDRQWVKREKSQPDESESFMAVFTKELHYVPDTPPDRGSRVTNPCVFYIMPELFLWWLSSCNKTKFHFIYFLWCTQLHSENNYSSIINLKNIVQTKQFLQYLHTKEEFCEMICEGLHHIASIVALIVSNLTRVSRSLWIDQGRCIDDLSHPSCKFTRKPCEN